MGLKDRLGAAKRWMWSPMEVHMLDLGSDEYVRAGEQARVVVDVRGEDDGTVERMDVSLERSGVVDGKATWPLGEIPATVGVHELQVSIPIGLAPSSRYTEYVFAGKLRRTKGTGSDAVSLVDVVSRPEDLYWPDGPRSGREGPADATIAVELDADPADIGSTLTGRAVVVAAGHLRARDVELEVGPVVDTLVPVAGKTQPQQRAKFTAAAQVKLADGRKLSAGERVDFPFRIEIPAGAPPTLHDGDKTSVVWQARVSLGTSVGWTLVGVLDPESLSASRNLKASGLLDLFV
jgi:SpoOM protein